MYQAQSKYFDIFYNESELYASRLGEPCALPHLAYGLPNLVTHKNISLLSTLLSREEACQMYESRAWPFPFVYGALVDLEVVRYEFRYVHNGQKFFTLFVSDIGRDLLDNIPVSFLVRNLINCSKDFSNYSYTDWAMGRYLAVQKAVGFFMRKLPIADLPEFLTHVYTGTRELAKEALDASV